MREIKYVTEVFIRVKKSLSLDGRPADKWKTVSLQQGGLCATVTLKECSFVVGASIYHLNVNLPTPLILVT